MGRLAFTKRDEGHDLVMCSKDCRIIVVEGEIADAIRWHFEQFHKTPSKMGWSPIEWKVLEEGSEELFPVCYDLDKEDSEATEELIYDNLLDWETKEWWENLGLPAPDGCKSEDESKVKFAVFLKN